MGPINLLLFGYYACGKNRRDDVAVHTSLFEGDLGPATNMGMKCHPDKSIFGAEVVEFLGRRPAEQTYSRGGLRM